MTDRMGKRSLQGEPFTSLLLHNRFYLSHVYEEYGIAMLTQHGIKCRMDRRQGSGDILTESGLRIEVKSSGSCNKKSMRQGVYWDNFQICNSKRSTLSEKLTHSDFFLFISIIGKCVFIVPTDDIKQYGKQLFTIPWTDERLAGDFRRATWRRRESTATFLFRYKNSWHLLEQAERDMKDEQAKRTETPP